MKYNFFLRLGLVCYLEFSIVVILSFTNPHFMNPQYVYSFIFSIICLLILVFFTLLIPFYTYRNHSKISLFGPLMCFNFSSLFFEFRPKSWCALLHNTIYILRWLMYALTLVFLKTYPLVQAILMLVLTLPMGMYYLIIRPFAEKKMNFLMVI